MKDLDTGWLTTDELLEAGFVRIGENTKVSRKSSLYGIKGYLGSNVRIDDYCILKGSVHLDDYVHLAAFCMISGAHAPVTIGRHVGISTRLSLFTGSDDYSADTLGGPTTPAEFTTQIVGPVSIGDGTMIGAHCVILPHVKIGIGASIGAGCIITDSLPHGAVIRASRSTGRQRYRRWDIIRGMSEKVKERDSV